MQAWLDIPPFSGSVLLFAHSFPSFSSADHCLAWWLQVLSLDFYSDPSTDPNPSPGISGDFYCPCRGP